MFLKNQFSSPFWNLTVTPILLPSVILYPVVIALGYDDIRSINFDGSLSLTLLMLILILLPILGNDFVSAIGGKMWSIMQD